MRGRRAVLVFLLLGACLWAAPDLDVLGPAPTTGTGPVEIEPLELPGKEKLTSESSELSGSSESSGFLGVSVPAPMKEDKVTPSNESVSLEVSEAKSSLSETLEKEVGISKGEQPSAERLKETSGDSESQPLPEKDPENQPLDLVSFSPERENFQPMGQLAMLGIIATLFGILFLWVWYRKQIRGKIQPNARLPMQVLGQTWLDGQSKILTLRVGSKILIVAKSAQYCTTLDIITDPEEVNLITLGGGQGEEDFQKVLKAAKDDPKDIPDAEGIQADLKELKRQLGTLKGSS